MIGGGQDGTKKHEDFSFIMPVSMPFFFIISAVFDGHGGKMVAQHMCESAGQLKSSLLPFFESLLGSLADKVQEMIGIVAEWFAKMEREAIQKAAQLKDISGTTANVTILCCVDGLIHMLTANVGDCRTLLLATGNPLKCEGVDDGTPCKVIMSHDDTVPRHKSEIETSGFTVQGDRVLSADQHPRGFETEDRRGLMVGRTIGDILHKEGTNRNGRKLSLVSTPTFTFQSVKESDFIGCVTGCDAIYDVLSNEEVGQVFLENAARMDGDLVAQRIVAKADEKSRKMYGITHDDMTVNALLGKAFLSKLSSSTPYQTALATLRAAELIQNEDSPVLTLDYITCMKKEIVQSKRIFMVHLRSLDDDLFIVEMLDRLLQRHQKDKEDTTAALEQLSQRMDRIVAAVAHGDFQQVMALGTNAPERPPPTFGACYTQPFFPPTYRPR